MTQATDEKLRDMAQEAWAKAGDPINSMPGAAIQEAVEKAYALGFEKAREEAARIADDHSGHGCECAYLIRAHASKTLGEK